MIWWVTRPSRARAEVADIADLAARSDWLRGVHWRIDAVQLVADFEITHLGKPIALTISYPSFFPDIPPLVKPRGEERLSGHQYGPGGELCLEFRPDNWEPAITGAMMIESAYRLLSSEAPATGESAAVESAHRSELGRDVRGSTYRLLLSSDARAALAALPQNSLEPLAIDDYFHAGHWISYPARIGPAADPLWTKSKGHAEAIKREGFAVRLPDDSPLTIAPTHEFLASLFAAAGADDERAKLDDNDKELPILVFKKGRSKLLSLPPGKAPRKPYDYRSIRLPVDELRLGEEYSGLDGKSVAIIGCGSMGSKIAASLARSGVTGFVLVDGDLFFPGNLVRNDLDRRAVGLNKPEAVGARIWDIAPDATIDMHRMKLGGQESAAATDAALRRIGRCDLIIDATAEPQIFNLCAAVAHGARKPMLWGEIYAGGVGGLVVRARPDLDPPPHLARRQVSIWFANQDGQAPDDGAARYATRSDAGAPPMIADDAEVSIVAAHLTRFATDILISGDSKFPYSAYVLGLREDQLFGQPFETRPIQFVTDGDWQLALEEGWEDDLDALVKDLLPPQLEPAPESAPEPANEG
jgi:hypothetical protein